MKKNKIKTKKALIKRIKVTGSGKLVSNRAFGRHLKLNKSKNRLRRIKSTKAITGTTAKKIKKALTLS